MGTAENAQPVRLQRLHPEADPVHSGGAKAGKLDLVQSLGIGFKRYLGIWLDLESLH